MKNKLSVIFVLFYFLTGIFLAGGKEFFNEKLGYYLDFPEGWEAVDVSDITRASFTDQTHSIVFQAYAFSGDTFKTALEIFEAIKEQLKGEGDGAPYDFSGRQSIFADMNFNTGKYDVKGYFVFINSPDNDVDYALFCFTSTDLYGKYHEVLLSTLDSFSPDKKGKLWPGPVSQFYAPVSPRDVEPVELTINGKKSTINVSKDELEGTQIVVEREANILAMYVQDPDNQMQAWYRSYRMMYRDNYHRLDRYLELLKKQLAYDEKNKKSIAVSLLSLLQDFKYYRTGTAGDMTSPMLTAYTFMGDCDSKALLYVLLLNKLGIDARLLVSTKYNHSAVGVLVDGEGAKLVFDGKTFVYAEMTEKVDLGMVPQKMADPSGWTGMKFGDL